MAWAFNPFTGNLDYDSSDTASSILTKLLTVDGAGSGLDADLLDGSHASAFASVYTDTKANVIAATKSAGQVGYATDTYELYISLGGGTWRVIPFPTLAESGVDMGIPNENNRLGYGDDYITDKTLSNVQIGTATNANEGGVWVDPSTTSPRKFYMRLNSVNNTIIIDFSTTAGYLVHYPFSTTQAVKVWSGMSTQVGQNGRPIINEYEVDMGAYPAPRVIYGGAF